jgi:class 3 adenylate cyclase/pimeloyl-ACP methyl ester carboxylesterase
MELPDTQYARNDGLYIAYQVWGDGPIDILEMNNGTNFSIDAVADEPHWLRYERRLSSFGRVIRYDPRGFGLSDGGPEDGGYERWPADALAVLDAAGIEQASVVCGISGAFAGIALAVERPERVGSLVLINATARMMQAPDYPIGISTDLFEGFTEVMVSRPDDGAAGFDDVAFLAPSLAGNPDFRKWWERSTRRSAGPAMARRFNEALFSADVRHLLAGVTVPTLVLARRDFALGTAHAQYIAERVPGARYVEVPGADLLPFVGEADALVDEIEEFLTGGRASAEAERVLATVMFTDVVGSTALAAELGDRRWRGVLDDLQSIVRHELERHRGRFVKDTGDGTLSTFPAPAAAIRCALAVRERAGHLGIQLRAGLHAGEVELRGEDIGGIAVHVAARVAGAAGAGDVLVSSTVADLVAGSGIEFADRGLFELRGVPGERRLLAVVG